MLGNEPFYLVVIIYQYADIYPVYTVIYRHFTLHFVSYIKVCITMQIHRKPLFAFTMIKMLFRVYDDCGEGDCLVDTLIGYFRVYSSEEHSQFILNVIRQSPMLLAAVLVLSILILDDDNSISLFLSYL